MTGDSALLEMNKQDTLVPDNVHSAIGRLSEQVFERAAAQQNICLSPEAQRSMDEIAAYVFEGIEPANTSVDLKGDFAAQAPAIAANFDVTAQTLASQQQLAVPQPL